MKLIFNIRRFNDKYITFARELLCKVQDFSYLCFTKIGCGSAKKLSKLIYLLSPFTIFAMRGSFNY